MEIRQKLSLDFGRDTHPITVFAKQNDTKTRFLEITPLNCGQAYAIEDGVTPRLQLTKADGHTQRRSVRKRRYRCRADTAGTRSRRRGGCRNRTL